jgi:hypothetical protein
MLYVVFSNIAVCYLKKKEFQQALDAALSAIDALPTFHRSYNRCSTAFQEYVF